MNCLKIKVWLLTLSLVTSLSLIPLLETSCAPQNTSGINTSTLAKTMVPDMDLDLYFYIKQDNLTVFPMDNANPTDDVNVESLAIWGIHEGNDYAVGGALKFPTVADANKMYAYIESAFDMWTKISDRTIFGVYGSGVPLDSLKSAILNNSFKQYDDSKALAEVAKLPSGSFTKQFMIGVVHPSQDLLDFFGLYIDSNVSETLNSIFGWVKPQVLTISLYTPIQISVMDLIKRLDTGTVWDLNLGGIVSINSSYPGIIFGPTARKFMDDNGYNLTDLENVKVYESNIEDVFENTLLALINVSGNHVYVTTSTHADYAKTLMLGIKR